MEYPIRAFPAAGDNFLGGFGGAVISKQNTKCHCLGVSGISVIFITHLVDDLDLFFIPDHHINSAVQGSVNIDTIWLCCCRLILASTGLDFWLVSRADKFISHILP